MEIWDLPGAPRARKPAWRMGAHSTSDAATCPVSGAARLATSERGFERGRVCVCVCVGTFRYEQGHDLLLREGVAKHHIQAAVAQANLALREGVRAFSPCRPRTSGQPGAWACVVDVDAAPEFLLLRA